MSLDGNFKQDSLTHSQPVKADKRIGDVIVPTNPEDEPCCGILKQLEMLNETGGSPASMLLQ